MRITNSIFMHDPIGLLTRLTTFSFILIENKLLLIPSCNFCLGFLDFFSDPVTSQYPSRASRFVYFPFVYFPFVGVKKYHLFWFSPLCSWFSVKSSKMLHLYSVLFFNICKQKLNASLKNCSWIISSIHVFLRQKYSTISLQISYHKSIINLNLWCTHDMHNSFHLSDSSH